MARERIFEPRIGSPRLDDVASFETLDWPGVWSFIPCLRCDAFRDDASERNPQLQFRLQSIFCRQEYDHISLILLVGAGRFERPTPCAQGRCATRLRYAPTCGALLILNHFLNLRYVRPAQMEPKPLRPWQNRDKTSSFSLSPCQNRAGPRLPSGLPSVLSSATPHASFATSSASTS